MTVSLIFANNASSRLYASIDALTTSIRVEAGDGLLFPQPAAGEHFSVTVEDRRTGQIEIMNCTGRSGDILNVQRHQEGTPAQAFMLGATVSNRLTAGTLTTLANAAGVLEAPADGKQYGRQDEAWTQVTWTSVANKPATFPPTLPIPSSGVTGLDAKQAAQDAVDATKLDASAYTAADVLAKLITVDGVGSGLDADLLDGQSGAYYLARANHTGTQAESTVTNLVADLAAKEDKASKGVANGYAPLDATTKVPAVYLPAYVDDVLEFANLASFPATGTAGVIYVALDTNKVYRWGGSSYTEVSPSPGSTDAVPEGATNLYFTNERVDDRTAALLQSGTGISWAYNDPSGTLTPTVTLAPFSTTNLAEGTNLYYTNARASAAAPVQSVAGRTGAVVLTKTDVGLGNVDNTPDANKPVSGPQQTALNLKADLASPTFTGDPKAPTPATSDNDTSVATTAYVKANLAALPPSGIADAPSDGLTYGRKNAAWATIVGGAVVSDTPPPGPLQSGQLWFESDSGNTFIWFTDADSSQWVQQNVVVSDTSGASASGAIGWFASSTAPTGYLKANGALISRTAYATLFAAIGTAFGAGDGSTTFKLPDLRGEFVRAWDDSRGVDVGRAFGSAQADDTEAHSHTFTGSALAGHAHTASSGTESANHTHTTSVAGNTGTGSVHHAHGLAAGGVIAGNTGTDWLTGAGGNIIKHQSATNQTGADHYHFFSVAATSDGRSAAHTHAITVDVAGAGTPAGTVGNFGGTETRPRNVALLACIKY